MLPKASLLQSFPLPTTDISAIPAPTFTQGGNTNLARASFSQVLSLIWFLIDIRVIIISRGRLVSFMCFTVIGESVTGLSCVCFTLNEMPAVTTDYFSTWKVSKISESVTQFDESHTEKHKKIASLSQTLQAYISQSSYNSWTKPQYLRYISFTEVVWKNGLVIFVVNSNHKVKHKFLWGKRVVSKRVLCVVCTVCL